jgi:hypothetical protein
LQWRLIIEFGRKRGYTVSLPSFCPGTR